MTWALKFNPEGNAGNDVVTLGTALVPGIGVGTSNWAIEFRMKLDALPASGNWYILGSGSASQNAGFVIRSASGSGVLALVSAGTHISAADSPVGFLIADGEFHTYRIVRVAGTSISFYRDGATIQLNKSWATTSNFTLSLNRFGRGSISGTGGVTPMELEWFDATEFDTTNGQRWESDLANGSGTVWPTVSGNNQGTLVNFTAGAEWVFYGSTPEFTAVVSATYGSYTATVAADSTRPTNSLSIAAQYASYIAAVNSTNTKPVKTISINTQYPAYTVSVNATGGVPAYNVSINSNYPIYVGSVVGTNTKPVKTSQISATYATYTANATCSNTKPIKTISISSQYPVFSVSVVATKQASGHTASILATYPNYTGSVNSTNTKPIKTVIVTGIYPSYIVNVVGTNNKPVKTVIVSTTYSSYTASVVANVVRNNVISINSTYPRYTANVVCGQEIPDKTLTINSTYPKYIGIVVLGDFVNMPYRGGKGAHLVISSGSREIKIKDKSRNVKWRVENARL